MKHYNKKERPKKGDVVVTGGIPHRKTYDEAFEVVEVVQSKKYVVTCPDTELLKVVPFRNRYSGDGITDWVETNQGGESFLIPSHVHLVMRSAK